MTKRAPGSRLTESDFRVPLLLAALGLAACQPVVGSGPQGTDEDDDDDDTTTSPANTTDAGTVVKTADPPVDNTPPTNGNDAGQVSNNNNVLPVCGTAAEKAEAALKTYCAGCHGADSAGLGGFKTVLDVNALITDGKVKAGDAENSPLYKKMSSGAMPPQTVAKRPAASDIKAVSDWIACGAPKFEEVQDLQYQFLDIDTRLEAVLDDLRAIPNPNDREDIRYLDLSNLSNAGYTKEQMDVYREAVIFLVNSLSKGQRVVAPEAIDQDQLLLRLELEDYDWDADTWNLLEQAYPYAVVYDEDSRLFPFDEDTAERIREETNTTIPIIQADWFISHAARPPIYNDILEIPGTLQELEQQLGIDIEQNIEDEEVLRAGFKNAGPSKNHRVIERHELDGNVGAFWLSYDFANNLDDNNIFANPLDFQEDGGEAIFNLDNGLQAYFVTNAAGVRQDKAPTNIVQDPDSRDGAVETGMSCLTCHQEEGMLPKFDEIREFELTTGANAAETEIVLALYAERDVLEDAFEDDQNRYRTARGDLGVSKVGAKTFHQLDDTHLDIMDINAVASVLGIPTEDLERALDAQPQVFPPEIVALRTEGGAIQRDAFEDTITDTIEALGLGQQLLAQPNNNNNVVNNNVVNSNSNNNVSRTR